MLLVTIGRSGETDDWATIGSRGISVPILTWTARLRRFVECRTARARADLRYGRILRTDLTQLAVNRAFEPELTILPGLVERGEGVCFDVGAHIGHYTYALAAIVGAPYVHAFEPHPRSLATLKRLFPDVCLWNLALSDSTSESLLRIPYLEGRECRSRATLEEQAEPGETASASVEVRTCSIDQFVAEHNILHLAFLKIDVEGHEHRVIRGAQDTLATSKPVLLVEIEQRHHQKSIDHIFETVFRLGYRGCFLDARGRNLLPIERFDAAAMQRVENMNTIEYINNFVFLPNARYDSVVSRVRRALAGSGHTARSV